MNPYALRTMRYAPAISLLMLCMLLTACGEFAYKRGASAGDLEQAKKSCVAKGGDASTVEKCMEDNGWVVQRFNDTGAIADEPLLAEASVSSDNRNMAPAVAPEQYQAKTANANAVNTATTNAAANASGNTALAAPTKKPADPLDRFKVSSWWKLGSGGESVKLAMNECVSSLGEAHKPDEATQTVTRGMIKCMGEKGWRGLRAK